jgi:hypothetical protein
MPEKTQKKKKKLSIEVITQMITLSTSGFGLVAALAWNNVIQEFVNNYIKKFLPSGSGIISLFLYALIITCIAVFITYQLSQIKEHLDG